MYTNCIVPLDGSDFAQAAAPIAAALAASVGLAPRVLGIAREDAELSLTYDHVHASAARTGISDVDVIVDPNPVDVLLRLGGEPGNLLCLASHDRGPVSAHLMHSVGSELIRRAEFPLMVVGAKARADDGGRGVIVAIDGVEDPKLLVDVGTDWSRALGTPLRIVTVYEPILEDLRTPGYYPRSHGPTSDPDAYLANIRGALAPDAEVAAIPDPVSVAAGLTGYLAGNPARILVLGGRHRAPLLGTGTTADVLQAAELPLLVVNHT
jgi:nucleotide-binding universal stress UspA family protein